MRKVNKNGHFCKNNDDKEKVNKQKENHDKLHTDTTFQTSSIAKSEKK